MGMPRLNNTAYVDHSGKPLEYTPCNAVHPDYDGKNGRMLVQCTKPPGHLGPNHHQAGMMSCYTWSVRQGW